MEVSGRRTDEQSQAKDGEIFCQPCSSDGDWMVAKGYCQNCSEFFCVACLKPHRKQSATRNHVILEGKNMPKAPAPDAHVDSCSELCSKHSNEIVKFFCASHDTIGCGDCMVLEHKVCKVERIQDISSKYFNSPEHRQMSGKVERLIKQLEELRTCIKIAEQDINTTYTKAVADIKAFRKEVNDYLDRVEAEILAEVNMRKVTAKKTVSELEADQQSTHNEIQELQEKLKLQSNKANELFVAVKKMKDSMTSFDRTLKQMEQTSNVQQYRFEKSPELKQDMCYRVRLGKLSNIKGSSPKKIAYTEPRFDGEISIKTPEDKSDCYIIASALISPSEIVLADFKNECVKLVDIGQGVTLDRYELCDKPNDIAVLNENQIAVTLPNKQTIQVLSLTKNGTLIESHGIKVSGKVRKIACQNGNLIIAYYDKVEILNEDRKVVKQVESSGFSWISNITAAHNSRAFFVSNSAFSGKPTAVYKFDFDGSLLATYKDRTLSHVRGLTVTTDGTLLVCNWADNGSVHMISPDCNKIKEILQQYEHIQRPNCVSFCDQTNKLFLCCHKDILDPKLTNVIKVFQME